MRRIRYSVAMSLDGYIAGPNGEHDWIEVNPGAAALYFKAFYAQFDTVLMGRKSYEEAGGGVSPFKTYVLSRTLPPGKRGKVTVLGADAPDRVAALRNEPGKDIWLWGGGELFGSLAEHGLVDTVEVAVIPVLLGAGRKVMAGSHKRVKLAPRTTDLVLPAHTLLVYDVCEATPEALHGARCEARMLLPSESSEGESPWLNSGVRANPLSERRASPAFGASATR